MAFLAKLDKMEVAYVVISDAAVSIVSLMASRFVASGIALSRQIAIALIPFTS
jgi:hypothetical protein